MDMESESVSGGNTPSAPATFAEAFAADASPASGTSEQSPSTPAAAEQPQVATDGTTPAADDPRSPFIPRSRFDEVNTKYNELKSWREQHGWAETVNREAVEQAQRIAQQFSQDKPAFLRQVLAESLADPTLAPLVRSELGRFLGQRSQQQPGSLPVFQLENGQTVDLNALKQEWTDEVRREFEPIKQTVQQQQEAARQAETLRQADSYGRETFADIQTWPGMDIPDNRAKLAEALKAMPLKSDDPRDVTIALHKAYRQTILPSLTQNAQARVLDNLQHKAAASISPNPGSAVPSSPKAITSFHDKGLQW